MESQGHIVESELKRALYSTEYKLKQTVDFLLS